MLPKQTPSWVRGGLAGILYTACTFLLLLGGSFGSGVLFMILNLPAIIIFQHFNLHNNEIWVLVLFNIYFGIIIGFLFGKIKKSPVSQGGIEIQTKRRTPLWILGAVFGYMYAISVFIVEALLTWFRFDALILMQFIYYVNFPAYYVVFHLKLHSSTNLPFVLLIMAFDAVLGSLIALVIGGFLAKRKQPIAA